MPALELQDSRRLTGANILFNGPGAVVDIAIEGVQPERVVEVWSDHARRALDAIGWGDEQTHSRIFHGGVSLGFSAPIDALYSATEVNEWALDATRATLDGGALSLDDAVERFKQEISAESNPALLLLRDAANRRGVMFLSDDEFASVGMGEGSLTWAVDSLPHPDRVPWKDVHDVPAVMVTGSNGKTTTVRLLAAMARSCGYETGYTCTDGIFVNEKEVEGGDYSGPGGARKLVRDRRVGFAILETARGGMLRRGLGIPRADAAIVTNVCEDHLGEFGAHTIADLVEAKLVIGRAVEDGALVINLDDTGLAGEAGKLPRSLTWFSRDPQHPAMAQHLKDGGSACFTSNSGSAVFVSLGAAEDVIDVASVPITVNGSAGHNVDNVLGAIALARSVGLPADGIRQALGSFGSEPGQNRGRTNFYDLQGLKVLVDFAHNPHGARALVEMTRAIPAERRMVMIGQAGDRDDKSIREMTEAFWQMEPALVVVKEMPKYLRGRNEGEVTGIILDELARLGVPGDIIRHTESEIEAVRIGLEWSRPGDFLVLPTLAERREVVDLLEELAESGWAPGDPLP